MSRPAIIDSPTFQLNLMLLINMPAPAEGPIRPLFANAGYRVRFVERHIRLPEPAQFVIQDTGMDAALGSRPDLLLLHDSSRQFTLIECKRSSFSPASSTARQARALLALAGPDLARYVGVSTGPWSSLVAYVCVEGNGASLLQTIASLRDELQKARLVTAEAATLELLARPDGVYIGAVPRSAPLINLPLDRPELVLRLGPDEDPRPLYLIPVMPGGEHERDVFGERVFAERLRATVAELLGTMGAT